MYKIAICDDEKTFTEEIKNMLISINYKYSKILIKVQNTYNGQIKKQKDKIISTKTKSHGIGLASVQKISEKYGGYINISYDHKQFTAETIIGTK